MKMHGGIFFFLRGDNLESLRMIVWETVGLGEEEDLSGGF